MAVRFPAGTLIALVDIGIDDRITMADFEGSQEEREAKFRQATSFQRAHKKKLLRNPDYDPTDPSGTDSGIPLTANEVREAFAEQSIITIPDDDGDTFKSNHLVIVESTIVADETNAYFKESLRLARDYVRTNL